MTSQSSTISEPEQRLLPADGFYTIRSSEDRIMSAHITGISTFKKAEVPRCSVPGCSRIHNAKGFCLMHYMRWKRRGDPLSCLSSTKHGRYGTKEYIAWKGIIGRCCCPSSVGYEAYGGRGITVCERWRRSFSDFLEDVGEAPTPEHSLDRFPDQNGNYEPGNVRWATEAEQNRNKRSNRWFEYDGMRLILSDWARLKGISKVTLCARINRYGWSFERAITTPVDRSKRSKRSC